MKIEERIELRLQDIGEKLEADLNRDDYKRWRISDIAKLRLEAKWLLSYVRELRKKTAEVVRCGECRHCHNTPFSGHPICRVHMQPHNTGPDNYCSWGERR